MFLRKSIYNVQQMKRYSVTLTKGNLTELFNQPKSKFKFFMKNQTVSNVNFISINVFFCNYQLQISNNIEIFIFRVFLVYQS